MTWAVVRNMFFAPVVLHTTTSANKAERWLKAKCQDEVIHAKTFATPRALRHLRRRQRISYRVVEMKERV
jgi:hypothetical protein